MSAYRVSAMKRAGTGPYGGPEERTYPSLGEGEGVKRRLPEGEA